MAPTMFMFIHFWFSWVKTIQTLELKTIKIHELTFLPLTFLTTAKVCVNPYQMFE